MNLYSIAWDYVQSVVGINYICKKLVLYIQCHLNTWKKRNRWYQHVLIITSLILFQYECCGVVNGTDWFQSSSWNNEVYLVLANGSLVALNLTVPMSCCKLQYKDSSSELWHHGKIAGNIAMITAFTDQNNLVHTAQGLWRSMNHHPALP